MSIEQSSHKQTWPQGNNIIWKKIQFNLILMLKNQ